MKIVQINTFPYKATGHIMLNLHSIFEQAGYESYVCWGRGRETRSKYEINIEDNLGIKFHGLYTRVFDKTGFASIRATRKLLKRLDDIKPDVIHLHNIHGYYVNIELLFNYIRENKIKIVWTLHDCWAFTGHCAWFDLCGCDKWITRCNQCPQLNTYPASKVFDNSEWNWAKKKELFTGLDITIVTPSKWLASLVKKSFLMEYPVVVIHNGIDLNIFKPTIDDSIRKVYGLDERKIVLGVASEWTPRKGLTDIIELSRRMPEIQFVVVGLTDKQMKEIPSTIVGIKRTNSQKELAQLYSMADIFFNPTYEDNYPTTNLEAIACGTSVITYDTGGSPEAIVDASYGEVVRKITSAKSDMNVVEDTLRHALSKSRITLTNKEKAFFDMDNCFNQYIELYQELEKKEQAL